MRRGKPQKRMIPPDVRYNSVLVAKMINKVMLRGQKATAEKIVYKALQIAQQRLKKEAVEILEGAVKNVTPLLKLKPRRVAGATFQVPVALPEEQGVKIALRWLVESSRAIKGKPMAEKLASEIVNAYNGQGASVKKKEELHKMAEANRAFVHYRW